jgi:hypothetical protein
MANLRANVSNVEMALFCAAALSGLVAQRHVPATRKALETLEQSLERGASRDERLKILGTVTGSMPALLGPAALETVRGLESFAAARESLEQGLIDDWLTALLEAQMRAVAAVQKDVGMISERAWQDWRTWAMERWPTPSAIDKLSIWNIATRAADQPPGVVLRDDPMAMSVAEWSAALRMPLALQPVQVNEIREWFVPLALAQLGFWAQAEAYPKGSTGSGTSEFAGRIAMGSKKGGYHPPCLILSLESSTVAMRWRPSPQMGCVAAGVADMVDAVRDLTTISVSERLSFKYLLVAVKDVPSGDQVSQGTTSFADLRGKFEECRQMRLVFVGAQPLARGVSLPAYYLESLPTLEDAVQHLDRRPQTAWGSSPA